MNRNYAAFVLLAATAGLSSCSSEPQNVAASPEIVRNVLVLTLQQAEVPDVLEAVGTVRAVQTSALASQMMGTIVEIRVHEGDRVKRGEVLAVIDDSQPHAAVDRATAGENAAQEQLAAAESDLALAQSTLKRYENLYEKKSVSPQEFDEIKTREQAANAHRDMAKANQAQANAALAEARTALEYSRIRAPYNGVITEKKADAGMLASPGMPILTIEDVRRYRLEAPLNEGDLSHVRVGQTVPVAIDALGEDTVKGKVAEIVPAADPASRSFLIKVDLPADSRLRSGLFGRAQFARGERQSLLIPRAAVVEHGQLQGVFVLDPNRIAALHYVTLGRSSGKDVEVLAGMQNGDQFVAAPGALELDGKRIEAQP